MDDLEPIQMGFPDTQLNSIQKYLKILANIYLFSHIGSLNSAGVGGVCMPGPVQSVSVSSFSCYLTLLLGIRC